MRVAASQLVSGAGRVVALIGGASPHALVVARSADRTDVDAGALVRQICAAHGGKGGGRPDLAQAGGVARRTVRTGDFDSLRHRHRCNR